MSDKAAQDIIKRSITDDAFRRSLKDDFDNVTSDLDLTSEERDALRGIDWSKPIPNNANVLGTWVHIYKSES